MWMREKEIEKNHCLCKFHHLGHCGVCPNLLTAPKGIPVYQILFPKKKDSDQEDYWERKNREYLEFITRIKQLDPSRDIFRG